MYIRTPAVRNKLTGCLSPARSVFSVFVEIITALLQTDHEVSYRISLLPRLPTLLFTDLSELMKNVYLAIVVKRYHFTLHKNKSLPSSLLDLQLLSFTASPLVQANDVLVVSPSDSKTPIPSSLLSHRHPLRFN